MRFDRGGSYEVAVLNRIYRIDTRNSDISQTHPPASAGPDLNCGLAAVVYLVEAVDIEPTGEWVSPRDLPAGFEFFRGPHDVPVGRIVERFGADRDAFEAACRRLGGRPEPYADAAYSFHLFPRLPVAVLLWVQDDEFPARAAMLVDRTAGRHFPLDALLSALNVMQNALITAASV